MALNLTDVLTTADMVEETTIIEEEPPVNPLVLLQYYATNSRYIERLIYNIMDPIMVIIGVIGNLLTVVVLRSKYFRNAPSSFLLTMMALVDTAFLLSGGLGTWLTSLTVKRINFRIYSHAACAAHVFSVYFLPQLSAWTLVLLTVERLLSVVMPFKAREICSRTRMIIAWVVTAVILFGYNSVYFASTEVVIDYNAAGEVIRRQCFYRRLDRDLYHFSSVVNPWLTLILYSLLPVAIIFPCNIVIITFMIRAARMRSKQMAVKEDDKIQSVTFMLVAISVTFLLATMPYCVFYVGLLVRHWPLATWQNWYDYWATNAAVNVLILANHTINFILYCITGSKFRRAVLALFCCREVETRGSSASKMTASSVVSDGKSVTNSTADTKATEVNNHM